MELGWANLQVDECGFQVHTSRNTPVKEVHPPMGAPHVELWSAVGSQTSKVLPLLPMVKMPSTVQDEVFNSTRQWTLRECHIPFSFWQQDEDSQTQPGHECSAIAFTPHESSFKQTSLLTACPMDVRCLTRTTLQNKSCPNTQLNETRHASNGWIMVSTLTSILIFSPVSGFAFWNDIGVQIFFPRDSLNPKRGAKALSSKMSPWRASFLRNSFLLICQMRSHGFSQIWNYILIHSFWLKLDFLETPFHIFSQSLQLFGWEFESLVAISWWTHPVSVILLSLPRLTVPHDMPTVVRMRVPKYSNAAQFLHRCNLTCLVLVNWWQGCWFGWCWFSNGNISSSSHPSNSLTVGVDLNQLLRDFSILWVNFPSRYAG